MSESERRALRRLIIIPAYNEEQAIGPLLEEIRGVAGDIDVLVIDDGSVDATAVRARAGGARVVTHPFNMGYGVSLQTGYKYATEQGYDLLIQLDGDGQHDPRDLQQICAPIERGEVDVTIGSRFLDGRGAMPPVIRRVGMVIFGQLVSWVTGRWVTDPTSGYQALSRRAFLYFTGDHFPFDYPDADVLLLLHRAHLRCCEIPTAMRSNRQGRSMHNGLAPIYYVFKMFLSMAMTLLRDSPGLVSRE